MKVEFVTALCEVPAEDWNRLVHPSYPLLRHEFLAALEEHDCLRPNGWTPMHVVARDGGRLVGAAPLYLKSNSYGEFVFDWSWAEAYERAGGQYYPKLVSAIPFTPVASPRLLVDPAAAQPDAIAGSMITSTLELAKSLELSSAHWLFPLPSELPWLNELGLEKRLGFQFHWNNPGYRDFDDFLDGLTAKRRKEIRRERREVTEQEIEIEVLHGDESSEEQWRIFHEFYCSTFRRKWGEPRLTLPFFLDLARRMPRAVVLLLASQHGRYVAGAFAVRGADTLYGRHWGCSGYHRQLHFELCYYRTIDYCIAHGLRRLDAGAQGEHKLSRGFMPVQTWSAHWLRDPQFGRAVRRFLTHETGLVNEYFAALAAHSPFREGASQQSGSHAPAIGT